MPQHALVSTVVVGLVLAFAFGAVAHRLKASPLVGYLLAGIVIGPFTPGFIADQNIANELSEIGIILLMFGVGLQFSMRELLSVRAIAVPGAIAQIAVATALGVGLARLLGWPLGVGIVFGAALSVASTVVVLRTLQERRLLDTERGHIAVGWLVVEDRKSTRLNSSHVKISYAVFCLKKKNAASVSASAKDKPSSYSPDVVPMRIRS